MQYFGARSRAYDTDVIQLFKALADFTQPIELQKTLNKSKVSLSGWPDWAIYRRLGDFLKHTATIILTQIAQIFGDFLGDFWKMAQILIFYVIKKI